MPALTLLSTVKDELGITDTSVDGTLTRYINQASEWIESRLDRRLESQQYTHYLLGTTTERLPLVEWPVTEVTEVEEIDVGVLEVTDYMIDSNAKYPRALKRINGVWKSGNDYTGKLEAIPFSERENYKVEYTAGYILPADPQVEPRTLPYDLEQVVINMVAKKYQIRCIGGNGLKSYKVGGRTLEWKDTISGEDMDVISLYERVDCI